MSKYHHFSHVMILHFYFGGFLSWFAVILKISKVQYSCNIKDTCTYALCNIIFTEFSLDQK